MSREVGVEYDDIEAGLGHLSSLASELHDHAVRNSDHELAVMAERIAYLSWLLCRVGKFV